MCVCVCVCVCVIALYGITAGYDCTYIYTSNVHTQILYIHAYTHAYTRTLGCSHGFGSHELSTLILSVKSS